MLTSPTTIKIKEDMNVRLKKVLFICFSLIIIIISAGCLVGKSIDLNHKLEDAHTLNPDLETDRAYSGDNQSPPFDLDPDIVESIDWELTGTFTSNGFVMRGHPNNVGFIDYFFKAGQGNKYMWHVWGEDVTSKNLTVLAIQENDSQPIPVFFHSVNSENKIWSIELGGAHNGADAHAPSLMGLPSPGLWALLVYIDDGDYLDYIVIEVRADEKHAYPAPPFDLDPDIVENIDWELTGTFISDGYEMRGHKNKIGYLGYEPVPANMKNKYMWHVWGNNLRGKELTVIALKEGEQKPVPVFYESAAKEDKMWNHQLGGTNNGADAHIPSLMGLPSPGKWALLVYIDDEYFENIIIEVTES